MDGRDCAKVLKKEKSIVDYTDGLVRYVIKPVDMKEATIHGDELCFTSPVDVGDKIFCLKDGRYGVREVWDVEQKNYLPRFQIGPKAWVGRSKIFGKVEEELFMPYIDLEFLVGKNIFVTCEPEVLDFTSTRPAKLVVMYSDKRVDITLPSSQDKLRQLMGTLKYYLTGPDKVVLCWNIKSLFTYVLHKTGKLFCWEGNLCDLQVAERFVGVEGACPKSYEEALQRISRLTDNSTWDDFRRYYQKVGLPLMSRVLPEIETTFLIYNQKPTYSYYEVDGQANGRLKCSNALKTCYNPHTMSPEMREALKPSSNEDVVFLYLDYRHMEVSVLQWLSNDNDLFKILESGRDLYAGIWEQITKMECNDVFREKCKSIFLPVVYGQGSASVSKRVGVSEKTAIKIIDRIYKSFPVAMDWIKRQQNNLDQDNFSWDHYGRRRQFSEQQYRIRNFAVQAPAATICLHKLINLFDNIGDNAKVVFHIHDGYGILAKELDSEEVARKAIKLLEAEDTLYPGLKLKVSCKVGKKLSELKTI